MISAVRRSNDDLTSNYKLYSKCKSFLKKVAHSNMCFQTCTLQVLHCHVDENKWILEHILCKSWQVELNQIWLLAYRMIEVQLFSFAVHVAHN